MTITRCHKHDFVCSKFLYNTCTLLHKIFALTLAATCCFDVGLIFTLLAWEVQDYTAHGNSWKHVDWSNCQLHISSLSMKRCLTHWLLELFSKNAFFWTFWWFLGWILPKLALIWSKMHLQHDSLPFLLQASRFTTFRLGHAQKSKFWVFGWESDLHL